MLLSFVWFVLHKTNQIKINRTTIYLVVFALAIAIQYALIKPTYTASYLITICLLLVTALLCILITNTDLKPQAILTAAAIGILINSYIQVIFCILQLINFPAVSTLTIYGSNQPYLMSIKWFFFAGQITGSIAQPNNLADLLCWGIIANAYLSRNNLVCYRVFFYLSVSIFSIFIAISQSRTAYLYPLILLLYSSYLFYKYSKSILIKNLFLSSLIMCLCILLYKPCISFIHHIINLPIELNITTFRTNQQATTKIRYILWLKGILIFLHHPIIGGGWDSFAQYYAVTPLPKLIQQVNGDLSTSGNAHNLIVQLLATTGLIGTGMTFWFISKIIIQLKDVALETKFLPLGIFLIVLTHSMFEFPLFNSYIFITVMLLLSSVDDNIINYNISNKSIKSILLVVFCFTSWQTYSGINNYLLLTQLKKPQHYQVDNLLNNELNRYFQVSTNPFWDDYADISLSNNLMFNTRTDINVKYFDLLQNTLTKVNTYFPNPPFTLKLAVLDIIAGNHSNATKQIQLLKQNYIGYEKLFSDYVIGLTPEAPEARKQVLLLLNNKA